jgi:hypothetical protein
VLRLVRPFKCCQAPACCLLQVMAQPSHVCDGSDAVITACAAAARAPHPGPCHPCPPSAAPPPRLPQELHVFKAYGERDAARAPCPPLPLPRGRDAAPGPAVAADRGLSRAAVRVLYSRTGQPVTLARSPLPAPRAAAACSGRADTSLPAPTPPSQLGSVLEQWTCFSTLFHVVDPQVLITAMRPHSPQGLAL